MQIGALGGPFGCKVKPQPKRDAPLGVDVMNANGAPLRLDDMISTDDSLKQPRVKVSSLGGAEAATLSYKSQHGAPCRLGTDEGSLPALVSDGSLAVLLRGASGTSGAESKE